MPAKQKQHWVDLYRAITTLSKIFRAICIKYVLQENVTQLLLQNSSCTMAWRWSWLGKHGLLKYYLITLKSPCLILLSRMNLVSKLKKNLDMIGRVIKRRYVYFTSKSWVLNELTYPKLNSIWSILLKMIICSDVSSALCTSKQKQTGVNGALCED